MKRRKSKDPLHILAVVAHPHDITHMCGTLGHHVERGDAVTAVAVTGGIRTHRERLYDELRKPPRERNMKVILQTDAEYAAKKSGEMAKVCALFGVVDVRVLPFADMFFEVTAEAVEVLATIIRERQPHLVLTNAPLAKRQRGYHHVIPDDHVATGVAVHRALARAATPDPEGQQRPHQAAAVYYTGVDFPMEDIDVFVDISDQAANRIRAEKMFASQGHSESFARKRIEIGAGYYGWHARVAYAEGWVRGQAELGRYLTVTAEQRETAQMPHQDLLARMAWSERQTGGRARG
jgi:LmbE family N-acetylglucosaminyl deacetylase